MKTGIQLLTIFCCFATGCSSTAFNTSKVGDMSLTSTTVSNGRSTQWEWLIPEEELKPILSQISPRDPKYNNVLVSGYQTASLSYEGKHIEMSWWRVKMAQTVILMTIQGEHYMLEEPHSGEFYKLLQKHKRRSSQPSPPFRLNVKGHDDLSL